MKTATLHNRSDIHLPRKIWHFTGVLIMAIIYQNVEHSTAVQIMALISALFVIIDLLRRQMSNLNNWVVQTMGPIMRENERYHLAGTTYLMMGSLFVMVMFPKPIVVLTLVLLAIADPVASYVGILYGKDKIWGRKSLQGTLAAFIVSVVISGLYFYMTNAMVERLLIVSLLTGIVASLSELLQLGDLDDNLTFPPICSAGVWMIYYLFAGV
jgi:dolichol kinase